MAKVENRYQDLFKEVMATLKGSGLTVKAYGTDGRSELTDEFGIDSVVVGDAVNNAKNRFSVWMKDKGQIRFNVGVNFPLYNTFIDGSVYADTKRVKSDNERVERSFITYNASTAKAIIESVGKRLGSTATKKVEIAESVVA